MKKISNIIAPSFDPKDGGIQALASFYAAAVDGDLKIPLVMNWKYRIYCASVSYNLVVHGLEMFPQRRYQKLALWLLIRWNPPKFVIYVSNFTKNRVEERHKGLKKIKSAIFYNPVLVPPNAVHGKDKPFAKQKLVVTVARLVSRKNLSFAIEAFRRSGLIELGYSYVIIGDGPLRRSLQEQAECSPRVEVRGQVSDEEKWAALRSAQIFLHPQIASEGDFEGFGISMGEAVMAGCTLIAGENAGIVEILDPEYPLLTDGTLEDIVRVLRRAVDVNAHTRVRALEAVSELTSETRISTFFSDL